MNDENTAKDKENVEGFDNSNNIGLDSSFHEKKTVIDPSEEPMDHDDATFYFFHGLAEKMILKRSDVGDICTLSNWLEALERTTNKTVRNDYIKLMTMALQYPEPICPFKDHPPEPIDPLEKGVLEMAKKFSGAREGTATCVGQNELETVAFNPSISTAVSQDRRQYASCQVIPDVGVQCYFAYSDDPIYYWSVPPQIVVPVHGPHATDLDWERAAAGVHAEAVSESMGYPVKKKGHSNKNEKTEDEALSFAMSSKFFRRKLKDIEELDLCKVMNIEQQNRNVTEVFGWNEGSLLTGEIIIGAEECSDRKIDAHVNTQLAIDEDAASVHERLYPGDFKIYVDPFVIEDVFPMNKVAVLDAEKGDDETRGQADDCTKNHDDHERPCCDSTNTNKNNRQRAGQENNTGWPEFPHGDCTVSKSNKKHRISELSAELAAMKTTTGSNKCNGHQREESTRCNSKPSKNANSLYETTSVEYQRIVNVANKSFDDIHSSFQKKRNHIPKKIGRKPGNLNDSNE